eukprot:jgi/Tetstr1/423240/TSEL_001358.t2
MLETRPNREQHSTDKRRCRAPARCRATAPTAAGDGAPGEMSTLLPPGGLASGEDVLNGGPERLVALLDAYLDEHGIRDTSNSVPFTMYVQLTVPLSKVVLFERWVQNLVVAQSQTRVGYQGTLLYRPDEALLEPVGATAAQVFVLDFRYTGAENLRAWIRSRTCASRLAKAMRRQLWLDGSVEATVTHGRVATLDNVWADAQVGALTEPVLAKWKLVLFSSAASWLVALALAWPQASVGWLLSRWHLHPAMSNVAITFLVVSLSVYVAIPYLQQYVTHLLADRGAVLAASEALPSQPAMPPGTPAHASVAGGAPEFQAQSPEAKPSAFDLMLLSDSIYGTFEEPNRHKERQCETLSVVVTYRVKPGMGEAFEAAAETLDDVVSSVVGDGFIGITIVRPFQGSNSYSTIVQFAKRTAMEEWLVSDARRGFLDSLGIFLATQSEVKLQDFSTVDLLMADYNTAVSTTPPSQWKTVLVVTLSVMPFVAVSELLIAPWLKAAGFALPWIMLATVTFNTYAHAYLTTPCLSALLSEWLHQPGLAQDQEEMSKDKGAQGFLQQMATWLSMGLDKASLGTAFWFIAGLAIGQRPYFVLAAQSSGMIY